MSNEFQLNNNHVHFIFENNEYLNVFNLLRLIRNHSKENDIFFDICNLNKSHQSSILSKFPYFLRIYNSIITDNKGKEVSVRYSYLNEGIVNSLCDKNDIIQDGNVFIFSVEGCSKEEDTQDPHLVKNVRGAVLLSLVQDLINLRTINNSFSLFNEKSPILLHAASIFLFNNENAKMVWDILERWENEFTDNVEINKRIYRSLEASKSLSSLSEKCSKNSCDNSDFKFIFESLESCYDFKNDIYCLDNKINLWFIDDQHANGWRKLIVNLIPEALFNIESFGSKGDVHQQLEFVSNYDVTHIPDLALVDLRLDSSDVGVEAYSAQDLSGFTVVDMLLEQWSGLSIMITSASNKLWNMEKAIQKGAVAYWRKSDEVTEEATENSILTAFDIHIQFIDKFSTALKKMEYKHIFKIVEKIIFEVESLDNSYNPLKLAVNNYFDDLCQKTSWMCWRKENDIKINDSLFLGITEVYNEIENYLWTPSSGKLVLVPEQSVRNTDDSSDKQVINDSLDYIDRKYGIRGIALKEYYEKNKGIRNKLPIIHGSESKQDVKHAELIDIELSLLIVWCLIIELKRSIFKPV
ncbi:response regulator [Vibrio splendidus]|uniref:response regulator n=1 Tax=Vibrio splendidus TaxID=29497 RepID=UPI000D33AF83|nr:response regulator [Vibrio splendidus]PTO71415.1 hypothetical protein CWN81_14585 [Vibrio splendidus]